MRNLFSLLILAILSFVSPAMAETISGTASVIDGDTVEIHGRRIRLNAMDAIESRQRCTLPDGKSWNCGRDASFALADKIGRSPLSCSVVDIDRYGRAVAICRLRGEDVGGWMVENGWAVAYRRYGTQYVAAEDRARKARRGIWASRFVMPWDWRRGVR
ncbi:thermonuclease family protein [Thioclava sp. GXIMD4215]|uniref:thermonuclease family protein n=1 Tax=Thioclava sp. GXIMD4215 TaxID=3131928 RepID=UPI00311B3A8A